MLALVGGTKIGVVMAAIAPLAIRAVTTSVPDMANLTANHTISLTTSLTTNLTIKATTNLITKLTTNLTTKRTSHVTISPSHIHMDQQRTIIATLVNATLASTAAPTEGIDPTVAEVAESHSRQLSHPNPNSPSTASTPLLREEGTTTAPVARRLNIRVLVVAQVVQVALVAQEEAEKTTVAATTITLVGARVVVVDEAEAAPAVVMAQTREETTVGIIVVLVLVELVELVELLLAPLVGPAVIGTESAEAARKWARAAGIANSEGTSAGVVERRMLHRGTCFHLFRFGKTTSFFDRACTDWAGWFFFLLLVTLQDMQDNARTLCISLHCIANGIFLFSSLLQVMAGCLAG